MKKPKFLIYKTIIVFLCLAIGLPLLAADTGQINYQARLLDSFGRRLNTTVNLSFKIYDAVSAGNLLWSETQAGVTVQDGVYSVVLGSQTPIPAAAFAQNSIYLELGINGETMTPRQQITASAYALVARTIMGSNVFEDQVSGYVGVGTTNPAVKLDVSGTVQATGFKMPTGATPNYVLVSDAGGAGTWQSISVVITEIDPIHTNWVRTVFTPATNDIWNAVNDRVLAATYNSATGALWGAVNERVLRAGDTMTGPLTNLAGFVGNGAGLTNVPSSGVVLTGYVQRTGDSMSGPLTVSNNVIVTLTNQAGWIIATNSISLGGMMISNWTQVGGGNLTNDLVSLQGATNTLNAAVTNLNAATNNLLLQITNNLANQALTNTAVNLRVTATETGMVKKIGDTMTGILNIQTNLVVSNRVGIGTASPEFMGNGSALDTTYKLNVNGNIFVENGKINSGNGNNYLDLGSMATGNDGELFCYSKITLRTYANPGYSIILTGGNVGIWTNNPSERLHVNGSVRIETNLVVSNSVGIGTTVNTSYKLNVKGSINIESPASGSEALTFSDNWGSLSINHSTQIGTLNSFYYLNLETSSGGSGYIKFSPIAVEAMRITSSGRVGIGTNTPSERLHVNGSAIIETNLTVKGTMNVVIRTGGGSISYSNLYYYAADGNWGNACATSSVTAGGLLGLALGGAIASDGLLLNGYCTNNWGFTTPGSILYMGTNANEITTTRPTGTNQIVRVLGYAISATNIYFNPDRTYIEIVGE